MTILNDAWGGALAALEGLLVIGVLGLVVLAGWAICRACKWLWKGFTPAAWGKKLWSGIKRPLQWGVVLLVLGGLAYYQIGPLLPDFRGLLTQGAGGFKKRPAQQSTYGTLRMGAQQDSEIVKMPGAGWVVEFPTGDNFTIHCLYPQGKREETAPCSDGYTFFRLHNNSGTFSEVSYVMKKVR